MRLIMIHNLEFRFLGEFGTKDLEASKILEYQIF